MFTTLVVQPIFNLLALIYALIPGHNFGLAIIIFTILVRTLMWPLVKKQLHHAKAIRALQPEMKKIKKAAAGNRQKESQLTMELYKERQINPFASLGLVILQIPIFIALYLGISKIVKNPQEMVNFSYPFIQDLSWMKTLAKDISQFDNTLFGIVDLHRKAIGPLYLPALLIAVAAAAAQFLQSKQLMPNDKEARSLKKILKEAGKGKAAEQHEVNAAVGRSTLYIIPGFVLLFSLNFAAALPLYWLTNSVVAYFQQSKVLNEDVAEAEALTETNSKEEKSAKPKTKKRSSARKKGGKRRKR